MRRVRFLQFLYHVWAEITTTLSPISYAHIIRDPRILGRLKMSQFAGNRLPFA
jgi:hypothetical protein